jgi:anti-sigma factor RsiW
MTQSHEMTHPDHVTHQEMDARDVVDHYVRGTLMPAEREAFEAHFFECDACFAGVREAERLRSAVSQAVDHGLLPEMPVRAGGARTSMLVTWLPMAASVVLAAGLGWIALRDVPRLRSELGEVRADRDALQARLGAIAATPSAITESVRAEANVPIVTLQAERAAVSAIPSVSIPATASRLIVWIGAPAWPAPVRLVVWSSDGREVSRAGDVRRNADGAYVVSLPSAQVPPGTYRLRLLAGADAAPAIIGEYLLRVSVQ